MNEWEWQLLEEKTPVDHLEIAGVYVRVGDRVRLSPREGGDILDLALRGQVATIESIDQDYEGASHVCVVLDADPGRDLGMMRQPGHRFFFDASEVTPLPPEEQHPRSDVAKPTILIAGIGNIFLGDDGFGVAVAQQLANSGLPAAVRIADFGLRGFDLTYALQDGYETTILVDAYPHGEPPGTVYVVEPDLNDPSLGISQGAFLEPHAMNPVNVLRMAIAMHAPLKRVLLVGCEPESFGGEEGMMGLSAAVQSAVPEAIRVITNLVEKLLSDTPPVNAN
jgi:hydrogenase maturation protease